MGRKEVAPGAYPGRPQPAAAHRWAPERACGDDGGSPWGDRATPDNNQKARRHSSTSVCQFPRTPGVAPTQPRHIAGARRVEIQGSPDDRCQAPGERCHRDRPCTAGTPGSVFPAQRGAPPMPRIDWCASRCQTASHCVTGTVIRAPAVDPARPARRRAEPSRDRGRVVSQVEPPARAPGRPASARRLSLPGGGEAWRPRWPASPSARKPRWRFAAARTVGPRAAAHRDAG